MADKELLTIADALCEEHSGDENEPLTLLCGRLFKKGIYTENTLKYLSAFYTASAENMDRIYWAANEAGIDTKELAQRYLIISMFVRKLPASAEDILQSYIKAGGSKSIVRAYLVFLSGHLIAADRMITGRTAGLIYEYRKSFFSDAKILGLGWLKFISEKDELTEEETRLAAKLVDYLCEEGRKFSFMKKLPPAITEGRGIEDRAFIKERFPAGSSPVVKYRIRPSEDWKSVPLKEKIKGLYGRDFVLFYGEILEYYCELDGVKGEVKTLSVGKSQGDARSRYGILNKILEARSYMEQDGVEKGVRRYQEQQAFTDIFFTIR